MYSLTYFLKKSILLFSLTLLAVYSKSQSQPPNIIYIMTDDMCYGDLSGYGRKDYSTPNLDKLASQGMKFVNAYSAGPLCTPGTVTQQVTITMDWTATILAAGGVKSQKDFPPDGIDLMPVLTEKEKTVERTIYWRTFQRTRQKAIRMGDWKYLQDEKGEYLFNLVNDPGEKNDLKATQQKIFNQLKIKYGNWEKTVLQPVPL